MDELALRLIEWLADRFTDEAGGVLDRVSVGVFERSFDAILVWNGEEVDALGTRLDVERLVSGRSGRKWLIWRSIDYDGVCLLIH